MSSGETLEKSKETVLEALQKTFECQRQEIQALKAQIEILSAQRAEFSPQQKSALSGAAAVSSKFRVGGMQTDLAQVVLELQTLAELQIRTSEISPRFSFWLNAPEEVQLCFLDTLNMHQEMIAKILSMKFTKNQIEDLREKITKKNSEKKSPPSVRLPAHVPNPHHAAETKAKAKAAHANTPLEKFLQHYTKMGMSRTDALQIAKASGQFPQTEDCN